MVYKTYEEYFKGEEVGKYYNACITLVNNLNNDIAICKNGIPIKTKQELMSLIDNESIIWATFFNILFRSKKGFYYLNPLITISIRNPISIDCYNLFEKYITETVGESKIDFIKTMVA